MRLKIWGCLRGEVKREMMERSVITSGERENFLGLMWEVLRRGNGVLEDDLLCHFGGGGHNGRW